MKVKSQSEVAQSFPTLRNPMDCSLPGSSVHGIFQARVLEWGAIAFSVGSVCIIVISYSFKKNQHFIKNVDYYHTLENGRFGIIGLNLNSFNVYLGEGNGTPLQYSCLENPMDGGTQ